MMGRLPTPRTDDRRFSYYPWYEQQQNDQKNTKAPEDGDICSYPPFTREWEWEQCCCHTIE